MRIIQLFIAIVIFGLTASAQDLTGRYEIQGLKEMVSVLKLNEDSTFNFYFRHGEADRYANGYWVDNNGLLTLNSPEKEQPDFILLESRHSGSGRITVKISDQNKQMLPFVTISRKGNATEESKHVSSDGEVVFNETDVDTIFLQHEIWTNEVMIFPVTDKKNNYFEFAINPEIANVVFKNIKLKVNGRNLKGMHPLLTGVYEYEKVK